MRRRLANIAEALRLRLLPMEVGYLWPPIKGTFAKVRFRQVWRPSSSFLPMKQPRPGMAPLNTRRFTICGLTLPPKAALSFWMDLSRRPGRSLSLGKQTIRTADFPGRPHARRMLSELGTVLSRHAPERRHMNGTRSSFHRSCMGCLISPEPTASSRLRSRSAEHLPELFKAFEADQLKVVAGDQIEQDRQGVDAVQGAGP